MTGCYIPGVKGGGPIQSIKNLVDNLSDEIDFFIVTSDRDLGDEEPYENIELNQWTQVENAKVYYTNTSELSFEKTADIVNNIKYDVMYLNSFFSYKFSIVPLLLQKMKKIRDKPVVLAPRGEFSKGALGLKSFKKRLYITLAKIFKLYRSVNWHSTDNIESANIQKTFGEDVCLKTIRNLTANYKDFNFSKDIIKRPGELKIVYISRIHPMKNLQQALEILKTLNGKVDFSIYGPIEDAEYWMKCKKIISEMPNNINVKYIGLVQNDKVNEIHNQNHIFFLLTLGENFGHVISEALIGGSPVVISNRTPWQNLQSDNVGWDLPLEENSIIADKLRYFIDLDEYDYNQMSKKSFQYAKSKSNPKEDIDLYFKMLSQK